MLQGNFALGLTGVKARQFRGDSSWSRDSLRICCRENNGFVKRDWIVGFSIELSVG